MQRAIDHARDVPYVRSVENYMRLKGDPLPPEPPPPSKAPEIMPAEQQPGLTTQTQPAAVSKPVAPTP